MMIHISFATAFPIGHPEREEGSLTAQALHRFRGILIHNATYSEGWVGALEATEYLDAPTAITAVVENANSLQATNPHDRLVHVLFAEGDDAEQWIHWLLKVWPENAGLVLVATSAEGVAYLSNAHVALERRHIAVAPCEPLVSDSQAAHHVLAYLEATARP